MAQQLQQHINRGNRRVARMTGRSEPAEHELRAEMHKRMYLLESGLGSRSSASGEGSDFSKRYMRHSSQAAKHRTGTNTTSATNTTSTTNNTSTGTGVSSLDIQAAQNGGLTIANKPTANNSLGLNIE